MLTGIDRKVIFEAVSVCEHCKGNGAEPGTPIHTCETCGGQGQVRQVRRTAFGQLVQAGICPTCQGDGRVPEQPCEVCAGAGRELRERSWDVEIPAGIESGQRIRISGAGHAGEPGGRPGDLYVLVSVTEDPRFRREGQELISTVEVDATLAMIGGKVNVPTLDGEREIKLDAGTRRATSSASRVSACRRSAAAGAGPSTWSSRSRSRASSRAARATSRSSCTKRLE